MADRYFDKLLDPPIDVQFDCETERLLRWLLKLLFNDARATLGASTRVYDGLRPFILGDSQSPSLDLNLLVGAIEPFRPSNAPEILYPEHHGFANFNFSTSGGEFFELFRGVFLNSYVFAILGWRREIPRPTRERMLKGVMEVNSLSELRHPLGSVRLTSSCMSTETIMRSTMLGSVQFSGS